MKTRMTAEAARAFVGYSVANAVAVKARLTCGCEPYEDVYTFGRWIAQGYCVRKGEHAIKIPVVRTVEKEGEDGETKLVRMFGNGAVFCRCQVAPTGR